MSQKYLYIILAVFVCIACQRPANSQIVNSDNEVDSSLIKADKDFRYNIIKYTYYNREDTTRIDSIKMYYADTKTLAKIEYNPEFNTAPNKWIWVIEYDKAEKVQSILYDYKNPKKGDTIKISWYPSGVMSSIMMYAKDSTNSTVISEDFHPNGILEEKGILHEIGSRRAPLGLWQYYDSTGVLTKTEDFVYPKKKRAYWVESEYYKNGQLKSEKQYYYDLEGVSDVIEPRGTWKYYDKQGNITKTKEH